MLVIECLSDRVFVSARKLECSSCSSAHDQVLLVLDCSCHLDVSACFLNKYIYSLFIHVNGAYISDPSTASAHVRTKKLPIVGSVLYNSTVHGYIT